MAAVGDNGMTGAARHRQIVARVGATLGIVAVAVALPAAGHAQTSPSAPTFSGSAAASGVRLTVTVPGAPATDTPIDGGGPTAQVAVDSIGTSTGYAAFPDPGGLILTGPGLVVGALAGGAGGLPPVKLPSPPNYPFFVASDASNTPEAHAGSGPYQLSANSDSAASRAQATSGFSSGLSGNAALAESTASLVSSDVGAVAKAIADLQGFSVGPLVIGEVKSVATETMDASGLVTPSVALEIAGIRVGGVPVELTPQGFVAGGPTYPAPLNPTLAQLLKASGIGLQFVAAQSFPDRVVAPALQVTFPFAMPFAVPNVGQFHGVATVIIGSATAQLGGAAADSGLGETSTPPARSDQGSATAAGSGAELGSPSSAYASRSGALDNTSAAPRANLRSTPGGELVPSTSGRTTTAAGRPADLGLDVRAVYLVVLAGALVAFGLGQVIRRLGGRAWISMGG